jgi:hypothetical protein
LTVDVMLNGQVVGSRGEVPIIETVMPFTFPLSVPVLVVVPHIPDNDGPDCAIVKSMVLGKSTSSTLNHVPATEAVPLGGDVGLEQPTAASNEATMSAAPRRVGIYSTPIRN